LLSAGLIVAAALAGYSNSLRGPFVFDDCAIPDNRTIRELWPIWQVLLPPTDRTSVDRRPVTNLSLALNYALGGTEVYGYHVFNLAAHVLAALTLFGVLRRTLLLPVFADRLGRAATPLALVATLIWTVHPLQTNAVTYIIQRTEVLAGLFYLLTLYCVIRGAEADERREGRGDRGQGTGKRGQWMADSGLGPEPARPAPRPLSSHPSSLPWYVAAVIACLLAVGSKESAVSAPVVVLLYDRLFLARSWREVWQRRRWLYLGLAATWSVTAGMLVRDGLDPRPGEEALGQRGAYGPWLNYLLLQSESIALYLRLCFWPRPLIVDYGPRYLSDWREIVPYAALVLALAAGTAASLYRGMAPLRTTRRASPEEDAGRNPDQSRSGEMAAAQAERKSQRCWALGLGFLGVWFFAILAPSTGVVPITPEWAAEKRMYLPLAAVVVAVVLAAHAACQRLSGAPVPDGSARRVWRRHWWQLVPALLVIGILMVVTRARNRAYQSDVSLYENVVQLVPKNPRGWTNLGFVLEMQGKFAQAEALFRRSLEIDPGFAETHNDLGLALARQGKLDEAVLHYRIAVKINPQFIPARYNLGNVLAQQGNLAEAIAHCQEAVKIRPDNAEAHYNLAVCLVQQGQVAEAVARYQQAVEIRPDYAEAHYNLGNCLVQQGRAAEAAAHYQQAVKARPDYAEALCGLAVVAGMQGKLDEAIQHYQAALSKRPDLAEAHVNLAAILAQRGRLDEAIDHWRAALQANPAFHLARCNLAMAEYLKGNRGDALAQWRTVLRVNPAELLALGQLAWVLATCPDASVRNGAEALELARRAVEIGGGQEPQLLDILAAALAESGQFEQAARTAEQARQFALQRRDAAFAAAAEKRRDLYQSRRAFHDVTPPVSTGVVEPQRRVPGR
jgi:tetratricopeptide (TPR) repeat protein